MTVYPLQASFIRGEISPKLRGRVDIEQYGQGLADAQNWLVTPQGGVERRPGTIFICELRDGSEKARLVEFEFNEEQAYCIVMNDAYFWFATQGALVCHASQSITAISQANPGVLTYSGADTFTAGDRLLLSSIGGMTDLNNRIVRAGTVDTGANTIQLLTLGGSNLNTTGFGAYTSGGTLQRVVEVAAASYVEGILFDIQFAQAADTLYIADDGVAPSKLVRTSETVWTLSTIEFEDGPWLPEETGGTTMTPASTGSVVDVDMSSNSTSGYAAADDDTSANAFKVFDRDLSTTLDLAGVTGWVEIDFPSATTKIADAYWLAASPSDPEKMPTHWTVEGYDGSSWVVVDARAGETAWAAGERRYYEFENAATFTKYRLQWYAVDGGTATSIAEWVLHQKASDQTAFNLTASATANINGGVGFETTDAGRTIRLMGSDGLWRWARVVSRTTDQVISIRLYGHAMLDLTPIIRWQMSTFPAADGYPAAVAFYQDRLTWGGTTSQPRAIFASESANYESHRISTPPVESDAITAEMTGNQLSAVVWIDEMGEMIVGTGGAVRAVGPAAQAEPFSSYNIQSRKLSSVGAAKLQPIVTDTGLLYVDRYRKRLIALRPGEGGLVPDDISWWSEHLFESGVVDIAFQEDRFNVAWLVMDDGTLVACTYLPEYGVVAFTPMFFTPTNLGQEFDRVESVAAIPSSGGAGVYLVVRRSINATTKRYLEYFAPRFETGDDLDDAVYLDCSKTVSVSGATTITGLSWLTGQSVGMLINGVDAGDATVTSAGTLTLPSTTTGTVTVGKRYTSRLEMLRPPTTGNRDGSSLGRQQKVHDVALDLLNAAGLQIGSQSGTARAFPHPDRAAAAGSLNTGVFPAVPVDGRWRDDAAPVITTDKAYPATIRSVIVGLDGSP